MKASILSLNVFPSYVVPALLIISQECNVCFLHEIMLHDECGPWLILGRAGLAHDANAFRE